MKYITLMRHAKTETGSVEQSDFTRQLTDSGKSCAQTVGQWLKKQHYPVELVLCSTAHRAVQTLEQLEMEAWNQASRQLDALYLASAGDMLAMLQSLPDEVNDLAIIGHNPGLWELSQLLTSSNDSPFYYEFKTGAVGRFACGIESWQALEPDCARLEHFWIREQVTSS